MKKFLLVLLTFTFILSSFAGCNTTPDSPDDTTTNNVLDVTPGVTTPEETTEPTPETTIDPKRRPVAWKVIKYEELGIMIHTIDNPNLQSIDVDKGTSGIKIYAYTDGETKLSFTDCFGHTASADVVVKGEELTVTVHPTTDDFIDATLDFGANGHDGADDTKAIQAAIDSAKPGQTVYIYPGIYHVDHLVMRDGITLEMYTTMKDAHEGFTRKLANDTNNGNITVLSGVRIMNGPLKTPGREGSSNFTVRGGVLDMKGTTKGAIIFGTADNVVLENVILKDMKNNHAIQLTGCTNTTVRNCMFAGYTWGGTFTREVLQVETSTPGATGAVPNSPLQYEEGEFNYSVNIEISHCYFGKSDKYGAPLMAIGHHSQAGDATITDFRIKDNIFDEVLYAGIRYNNIVDTEISDNVFISTSKYKNVDHADAKTPAFIIIYSNTANTTYTSIVNGKKITRATKDEQAGTHDLVIKNNTFNIGAGSDKKVIHVMSNGNYPGVFHQSGIYRQEKYNTEAYSFTGYSYLSNCVEGLVFSNNTINVEGKPDYTNFLMYFQQVRGLTIENNKLNYASGVTFSSNSEGILGLNLRSCDMGTHSPKYVINTGNRGTVYLGDTKFTAVGTLLINIIVEGEGYLEISDDYKGDATMKPVAAEGYVFDGFYDNNGNKLGADIKVTKSATWTVKFVKK